MLFFLHFEEVQGNFLEKRSSFEAFRNSLTRYQCLAETYRFTWEASDRGEEVKGGYTLLCCKEFCVRHPALQRQGSPVSLTDIFCNVSVSVLVGVLGFVYCWPLW